MARGARVAVTAPPLPHQDREEGEPEEWREGTTGGGPPDVGLEAVAQDPAEADERMRHRVLLEQVGVEDDRDPASVPGDALEVGQEPLAAEVVFPAPVPRPQQGDAAQAVPHGGVGVLDPLGDEERDGDVLKLCPDGGRDIERHPRAGGGSYLTGLPWRLMRGASARSW